MVCLRAKSSLVIALLMQQTSRINKDLNDMVIDVALTCSAVCCHRCGWNSIHCHAFLEAVRDSRASYAPSLRRAMELLENIRDITPRERSTDCTFSYKHTSPDYRSALRYRLNKIRTEAGICLNCLLAGNSSLRCISGDECIGSQ